MINERQNNNDVKNEIKYKTEVCDTFSERMHRKSKRNFRAFLQGVAENLGFKSKVDSNMFAKNVVIGDPEKAEYIFTAHYDTPPRLPKFFVKKMLLNSFVFLPLAVVALGYGLPYIMLKIPDIPINFVAHFAKIWPWVCSFAPVTYMLGFLGGANKKNVNDNSSGVLTLLNIMEKIKDLPQEQKDKICLVFFDNEEKALLGSISFRLKYNKVLKNQKIVNFDCVGLGKQVNAYHMGKESNTAIDEISNIMGGDYVLSPKKTTLLSMSDHIPFGKKLDCTTLLCVDKDNNKSLYSQIHSSNDTKIDNNNINLFSTLYATQASKLPLQHQAIIEAERQKVTARKYSRKKILQNCQSVECENEIPLEV